MIDNIDQYKEVLLKYFNELQSVQPDTLYLIVVAILLLISFLCIRSIRKASSSVSYTQGEFLDKLNKTTGESV